MQKAIITNERLPDKILSGKDRVYLGNDYCENGIDCDNIVRLTGFYSAKAEITLLLPFLTDKSFDGVSNILKKLDERSEVVFNDWGTFYFLRKYYPALKLVMGRLLTKQKKDPRAGIILKNKQEKVKIIKSKDGNKIVRSKHVPDSLVSVFSRHSVESAEFFEFLLKSNVARIEIDNLTWNMASDLPKGIRTSLYFPYMLLTVTRHCGAMNGKYKKVCNMDCKNNAILLHKQFYVKGNAVYFRNDRLPSKSSLERNNIDRIVCQTV